MSECGSECGSKWASGGVTIIGLVFKCMADRRRILVEGRISLHLHPVKKGMNGDRAVHAVG